MYVRVMNRSEKKLKNSPTGPPLVSMNQLQLQCNALYYIVLELGFSRSCYC